MAPFAYLTFDPNNNVSPCPAMGGSLWNFPAQSINDVWQNPDVTAFRAHMLKDQRHDVCHRCWNEERVGMTSERTKLWDPAQDPLGSNTKILNSDITVRDLVDSSYYLRGPMQLAIKISNVCNLRCRSCNSADSVTLSVEGRFYQERHGMIDNFWLKETETKTFTDQQIDDIIDLCHNVRRIEFYGGEPLLDHQLPRLLQRLVEMGLAPQIQLNISTNVTHRMSDSLIETLSQFQHLNINLSIDGWGERFTYLRHPANWRKVHENIQWFLDLRDHGPISMSLLAVTTVTSMNVYYLPETIGNLRKEFALPVYLILAWYPFYYSIRSIPSDIAKEVAAHLESFDALDLSSIVNALREPAPQHWSGPQHWGMFKRWNRMVDDYRGESFVHTFPEYVEIIRRHDPTFETET